MTVERLARKVGKKLTIWIKYLTTQLRSLPLRPVSLSRNYTSEWMQQSVDLRPIKTDNKTKLLLVPNCTGVPITFIFFSTTPKFINAIRRVWDV